MDILGQIVLIALALVGLASILAFFICLDWTLSIPALIHESHCPCLTYKSRVSIVGGFYAGRCGTIVERKEEQYTIDIDSVGVKTIVIRHLRPLLPPAIPAPKEQDEVVSLYPEIGDE